MGPGFRDSVATLMAKSSHMAERANFDQTVSDALINNPNLSRDQFSQSKEYKDAVAKYDAKLREIYSGVKMSNAPAAAGKPATPTGPAAPTTKSAYEQEKEKRRAQGGQ